MVAVGLASGAPLRPTRFKTGRRRPLFDPRHLRAAHKIGQALSALGAPPSRPKDYVTPLTRITGRNWRMMLNDTYGDCTAAWEGHALMLRTANTGKLVIPPDSAIEGIYSAYSGFDPRRPTLTDNGAEISVVTRFMETTGLLGHRSVMAAPVFAGRCDAAVLDRLRWTIQLFGSANLGVNLPDDAEDQFDAGVPWDVTPTQKIDGGHCVGIVKYDDAYFYCVTWGGNPKLQNGLQPISIGWMEAYCEEAWVEAFPDFIAKSGVAPSGFSLDQLCNDVAQLE